VPSQMVLQSSRSLADLAEQSVIPADYLYTLIIFFMFMVRSALGSLRPSSSLMFMSPGLSLYFRRPACCQALRSDQPAPIRSSVGGRCLTACSTRWATTRANSCSWSRRWWSPFGALFLLMMLQNLPLRSSCSCLMCLWISSSASHTSPLTAAWTRSPTLISFLSQVCAAPLLVTPGDQRRRQSTPARVRAAAVDQLRAVDAAAAIWLPAACIIQVINAKHLNIHVVVICQQEHPADSSQNDRQDKLSVQHVCFPSQQQLATPDDAVPLLRRGGRGRHSFVFSRSTGQLSWLGFQTFCSVPFLYELRQILDWSCTPTTLNLFDWLKLEVGSMFLCTVLKAVSSDMLNLAGMLCREALV